MSEQIEQALERKYDAGFYSEIESETFESGLDESVIRRISAMKNEPEWMLEWRLKSYRAWLEMEEPDWACGLSKNRLSVHFLLLGTKEYERQA